MRSSMTMLRNSTISLILILCAFSATAQQFKFETRKFSEKVSLGAVIDNGFSSPYAIDVAHDLWPVPTSTVQIKSIHDIVRFYVDHDTTVIGYNFIYKAVVRVTGYANPSNGFNPVIFSDTLAITYQKNQYMPYQDLYVKKYSGYHRIKVQILDILDCTNQNNPPISLAANPGHVLPGLNCGFEVEIWRQHYDNLTVYGETYAYNQVTSVYKSDKDILRVHFWDTMSASRPTPAMYELEWAYIDNYKVDMSDGSNDPLLPGNLKYDFKNNATRIITDKPYYDIPVVYEDGYIVYRARIVRPDKVQYRLPIYTQWSVNNSSGTLSSLSEWSNYFHIPGSHKNDSLNWQYTVSFAEDGKYKQVMSYFDGSLKNRQTITRFNSRPDNLIATENIYDYKGRPAISILPTPVINSKFGYVNGLSINSVTQKPYKAADFDTLPPPTICPSEFSISPLDPSALAYKYYSPLNTDQAGFQKFVPDAKGYPMIHTIIAPDNDKKILKQGGAGNVLQMADERTTKYYYVSPMQGELNRMFGTEIGKFEYYKKSVVVDPNNQSSIVITDNEGKTIATSLIGLGPDSAIHPIDPLPTASVTSTWENLLYGITQVPVNNVFTVDHNFYVETPGYHVAQYTVNIPPYSPCPNWYLTIGASYDYKMTDQCGEIKMQRSEVIGVTGVSNTPVTNTINGTPQAADLAVGPYNLVKNMTYSMDSVQVAVDRFVYADTNCLNDQNFFIKEVVKGKNFPCPLDTLNPCAKKKQQMKDELWPGAKYGSIDSAQSGLIVLPQTGYSIFDFLFVVNWTVGDGGLRYKYCQELQWPDTVWKDSIAYTNLGALDASTLAYIFNDDIAEALLPLHPEYCKRCDSAEEYYGTFLQQIPDYNTAIQLGYFTLDDIVAGDPLYLNFPQLEDSLKYPRYCDKRIDTICIAMAYCGGIDSAQVSSCFTDVFNNETSGGNYNITTAPALIKQEYFKNLIALYTANRNLRKKLFDKLNDSSTHCAPCDSFRMEFKPISVYGPDISSSTESDSSVLAQLFNQYNVGGDELPGWMFGLVGGGNQPNTYVDSLSDYLAQVNLEFCDTNVAHIAQDLINCTTNATVIQHIKDSLYNYYCVGAGMNKAFSPDVIRRVIVNNGLSLNDLCNPYLIDYLPDPIYNVDQGGLACKSYTFYNDAKAFFNSSPVKNSINNIGMNYPMSLSFPNTFQNKMIDVIGGSTVNIVTDYDPSNHLYKIKVMNSSNVGHVSFWLNKKDIDGVCGVDLDDADSWEFSRISCLKELPTIIQPSKINEYSFIAEVKVVEGADSGYCKMLGWNDGFSAMDTAIGERYNCLTCPEIRAFYEDFRDTMTTYGVCCVDHPLFETMLTNYVNVHFKQQFSLPDLIEFVRSCALADSIDFKNTYGNIRIPSITGSGAANMMEYIQDNFDTYLNYTMYKYGTSASSYEMLIDLNTVPYDKMLLVKNYILSSYSCVYSDALGGDTLAMVFLPASIGIGWSAPLTIYSGGAVSVAPAVNVDLIFNIGTLNGIPYKRYVVKHSGLSAFGKVKYTDSLIRLVANIGGGMPYCTYDPMIHSDYYKNEKKDFLQYNYSLQDSVHYMLVKRLKEDSLLAHITSYAGKNVTYNNPYVKNDQSDLFISDQNQNTTNLALAESIFKSCSTANSGRIFYPAIITPVTPAFGLNSASEIDVFRCGDNKTFWFRFFREHPDNQLYNLFVKMPEYVTHPWDWVYEGITMGQGDGGVFRFYVTLHHYTNSSIKIKAYGYCDFAIGEGLNLDLAMLCRGIYDKWDVPDTMNCEREWLNLAIQEGKQKHIAYLDSIRYYYYEQYTAFLNANITESLFLTNKDQKYHFTLYYYDQAGNLTRTVPPKGVNRMDTASINPVNVHRDANVIYNTTLPQHTMASTYSYNSLNKVYKQITPDGGQVDYYYDAVGRLVFSQTEVQKWEGKVSYNLYDAQGRIIETGQIHLACPPECGECIPALFPVVYNSAGYSPEFIHNYILERKREEVVATLYDVPYKNLAQQSPSSPYYGFSNQENLRKRVSTVKYFEIIPPGSRGDTAGGYDHGTYYSYDIAGNVKTLTQEFCHTPMPKHRYKRIDYDYDMLSGKVNMLSYNRGFSDQYYQRYTYDEDNRIVKAESSADALHWDGDADYKYYQHGPLARTELGDLRIQGVDYAYTIQGWLKAINSDIQDTTFDMGGDALPNSIFPKDVMSFALNYFPDDYDPIGNSPVEHRPDLVKGMYNGNISMQTMNIKPFPALEKRYFYDPINRISQAKYHDIKYANNVYSVDTFTKEYYNNYKYDANGNITNLVRYGSDLNNVPRLMDSFSYQYVNLTNKPWKLYDNAPDLYGNHDLRYMPSTITSYNAYKTDKNGRMTFTAPGSTEGFVWSHYDKAKEMRNHNSYDELRYSYDGAGNRVTKTFEHFGVDSNRFMSTDYYVRDASGNILTVLNYKEYYDYQYVKMDDVIKHGVEVVNDNGVGTVVLAHGFGGNPVFANEVIGQAFNNSAFNASILAKWSAKKVLVSGTAVAFYCKPDKFSPTGLSGSAMKVANNSLRRQAPVDLVANIMSAGMDSALYLWAANWPAGFDSLGGLLGIDSGSVDTAVQQIVAKYNYEPYEVLNTATGLIAPRYEDTAEDGKVTLLVEAWMNSSLPLIRPRHSYNSWDVIKTQALDRHLRDTLYAADRDTFIEYVSTNPTPEEAFDNLIAANGLRNVLETIYWANPDSFLTDYITSMPDSFPKALAKFGMGGGWVSVNDGLGTQMTDKVYMEVLVGQSFNLEEQHIYGSKRLGIQTNLAYPGQWYWKQFYQGYVPPNNIAINPKIPWYSLELGDLVLPNYTAPLQAGRDYSKWASARVLGTKYYELTNHLGDVQATLLDRLTASKIGNGPGNEDTAKDYVADVRTAVDYYPFGMIMPERYSDPNIYDDPPSSWNTSNMKMAQPDSSQLPDGYGPQIAVEVGNWSVFPEPSTDFGTLEWHGAGNGLTVRVDSLRFQPELRATIAGVEGLIQTTADTNYDIILQIDNNNAGWLEAIAYNWSGGRMNVLGNVAIPRSGTYTLNFTAEYDTTHIAIVTGVDTTVDFTLLMASMAKFATQQVNIPVTLLLPMPSKYRFGFNGQEKVDEVAGVGNHLVFKYREYDPRDIRFWSPDPLHAHYPWNSDYAFAEGGPINAIDLEGLEKYVVINYFNPNGSLRNIQVQTVKDTRGNLVMQNVINNPSNVLIIGKGGRKTSADNLTDVQRSIFDVSQLHCPTADNKKPAIIEYGNPQTPNDKYTYANSGIENQHFVGELADVEALSVAFYYKNGSATTNANSKQATESYQILAAYLKKNPDATITVHGMTPRRDNRNDPGYELIGRTGGTVDELLHDRAQTVVNQLIKDGVNPSQINKGEDIRGGTDYKTTVTVKKAVNPQSQQSTNSQQPTNSQQSTDSQQSGDN